MTAATALRHAKQRRTDERARGRDMARLQLACARVNSDEYRRSTDPGLTLLSGPSGPSLRLRDRVRIVWIGYRDIGRAIVELRHLPNRSFFA